MQITPTKSAVPETSATQEIFSPQTSQLMEQGDFIRLLVAQMTSQDPLKPMENQDMLAQMVQFSTLQQNTALQAQLAGMQGSQSLLQANSLMGRLVAVQGADGNVSEGIVSGVDVSSGTPLIIVNDTTYDLSQVLAIAAPAPAPNP